MKVAGWIAVLALALSVQPAFAESLTGIAPRAVRPGTVDIDLVQSIRVHPRSENLDRICRSGWKVNGCTDFPVETLECRCQRRGGMWVISATAKLESITHLPNSIGHASNLAHERRHLSDLEEGLRAHLERLASRAYESEAACRRFASFLEASTHLRVVMNELRIASNAKFGCSRAGE